MSTDDDPDHHPTEADRRRTHQDEVIVAALASGRSYEDAGAAAEVSARTVRRRMAEPAFATAVSARRGERVAAVTGQLVAAGGDAIAVITDCLGSERDSVRLRAAHLLLSLGVQLRGATELEQRITELETAQHGRDDAAGQR